MKNHCVTAALMMALAGIAVPVKASTISGTFAGTATLTPVSLGIATESFTGTGSDTTFGDFTASSTSTIDTTGLPSIVISDGVLSEVFGSGTLFGTTSGTGTDLGGGVSTFTIDFIITGGTGGFAGAIGDATLTGTITRTGPSTESFGNGAYTGSLTFVPEPSTLVLLAAGLAAFAWRRTRVRA